MFYINPNNLKVQPVAIVKTAQVQKITIATSNISLVDFFIAFAPFHWQESETSILALSPRSALF